jgi:hypothetical protein
MHHLCSLPKPGRFKCEKVRSLYFNEKYYMVTLLGKNISRSKKIK